MSDNQFSHDSIVVLGEALRSCGSLTTINIDLKYCTCKGVEAFAHSLKCCSGLKVITCDKYFDEFQILKDRGVPLRTRKTSRYTFTGPPMIELHSCPTDSSVLAI